jgi:PAS domain S-box-containing protein
MKFVERLQSEGAVRNLEVRFLCRDGRERVGLGSADLIEIANEPCIVSVIADITEQKQLQRELHESEQRLRSLVDSAMDAIIAVDENQKITLFNAAAEKMFGCNANEAVGTGVERFIPARFREKHEQDIRIFAQSGITNRGVGELGMLRGMCANGEEFPIEASISQVGNDEKKLLTVIIRDVTGRSEAEENLRRSEQRLRLAVQAGRMYADEWEVSTDTITRSPDCLIILGKDESLRITRQQLLAEIHSDDRARVEKLFTAVTLENPTVTVSYRLLRQDASVVWLEKSMRGVFDDTGKLLRAIGVVADITKRRQVEEALRSSEERFRRVVEHIRDALIIQDVASHVVFANDSFLHLFGLDRAQLQNLILEDYAAPEYRAELRDRHDRRMHGESVSSHFEYEGIRTGGQSIWLEVDVVPIVNETRELVGTQSVIRDVTERRLAALALQESEERFRLVANTAPVILDGWPRQAVQLLQPAMARFYRSPI